MAVVQTENRLEERARLLKTIDSSSDVGSRDDSVKSRFVIDRKYGCHEAREKRNTHSVIELPKSLKSFSFRTVYIESCMCELRINKLTLCSL